MTTPEHGETRISEHTDSDGQTVYTVSEWEYCTCPDCEDTGHWENLKETPNHKEALKWASEGQTKMMFELTTYDVTVRTTDGIQERHSYHVNHYMDHQADTDLIHNIVQVMASNLPFLLLRNPLVLYKGDRISSIRLDFGGSRPNDVEEEVTKRFRNLSEDRPRKGNATGDTAQE